MIITSSGSSSPVPAVEQRAAPREQAALTQLTVAVVTMRVWRQLAPPTLATARRPSTTATIRARSSEP
jgi:hypothetical protein